MSSKSINMSIKFEDNSWPVIKEYARKNALIVIPIGAIEQHGPHLPVSTDMIIAREISMGIVKKLQDKIPALVTPDIWPAYNGKLIQNCWPGSLTISQDTQKKLLLEVISRLIEMGFKKIICINSHGQNLFTLEAVVRTIADKYGIYIPFVFEYKIIADFMVKNRKSAPGGICHAGEVETSLMLYLTDKVDMSKTVKEQMNYKSKFRNTDGMASSKVFWSTWGLEDSQSGILGDPTVSTREMGEKIYKYIIKEISQFALEYYHFKNK